MTDSGLARRGGGRRGQGQSEYGLVLMIVSLFAILALTQLGENPKNQLESVATGLGTANGSGGAPSQH